MGIMKILKNKKKKFNENKNMQDKNGQNKQILKSFLV